MLELLQNHNLHTKCIKEVVIFRIATADLDGDGDLDMVMSCSSEPNQIHFNSGFGFVPTQGFASLVPSLSPLVSAIAPALSPTQGGSPSFLTGSRIIDQSASISIGGVPCTSSRRVDVKTATCVVPAGVATSLDVEINSFGRVARLASAFSYEPPSVTKIRHTQYFYPHVYSVMYIPISKMW